ncbi:MAG: hypothetical protein LC687_02645 [Actinobacteria bacterium]|nr:hypothetical protein [Actinomycetota bacterium]
MPLLEVTNGPTAPTGLTLASGTKLVVKYDRPYVDNVDAYPQVFYADYDTTNGTWKPENTSDGTALYLPGAGSGDPAPPRVVMVEKQVYSNATSVDSHRQISGIYEDTNTAGTWDYGSLPDGYAVVTIGSGDGSLTLGNLSDTSVTAPTNGYVLTWDSSTSRWIDAEAAGGGTGAVDSVFTRTGAVVAAASDYDASQIDNDSSVVGATVAAALNSLGGGANVSDARLIEWTAGEDYETTGITRDSDGVVTTATVEWPDGSAGTFTTVTKNDIWLCVDAYTVSHTDSGDTVTQSAVTRNSAGEVTTKPALTVA